MVYIIYVEWVFASLIVKHLVSSLTCIGSICGHLRQSQNDDLGSFCLVNMTHSLKVQKPLNFHISTQKPYKAAHQGWKLPINSPIPVTSCVISSDLKLFNKVLFIIDLSSCKAVHVTKFADSSQFANRKFFQRMAILSTFWIWCLQLGHIPDTARLVLSHS